MGHNAAASAVFSIAALPSPVCLFASVLHLQLNSLLQVLVGLLHQLFGPQHSVPHHVLGATAAGGDGATKRSNCRRMGPRDDDDDRCSVHFCVNM